MFEGSMFGGSMLGHDFWMHYTPRGAILRLVLGGRLINGTVLENL